MGYDFYINDLKKQNVAANQKFIFAVNIPIAAQ